MFSQKFIFPSKYWCTLAKDDFLFNAQHRCCSILFSIPNLVSDVSFSFRDQSFQGSVNLRSAFKEQALLLNFGFLDFSVLHLFSTLLLSVLYFLPLWVNLLCELPEMMFRSLTSALDLFSHVHVTANTVFYPWSLPNHIYFDMPHFHCHSNYFPISIITFSFTYGLFRSILLNS